MIYFYLARRDKTEVKVIALFNGPEVASLRVNDITKYNLPDELTKLIETEIQENKMLWEPWIESSDNYEGLKNKLRKRGYKNVPYKMTLPQYQIRSNVVSHLSQTQKPTLDPKVGPKKTMLRKTKLF